MPSLSLAIPATNANDHSGIIIEPCSPASSVCPFSPMSEDLTSGDESDLSRETSISPNLKFSFEDWHAPFNLHAACEVEYDEEGSQILLIPSPSPFYQPPPVPQFNTSFNQEQSDYSYPSVCPTLSSKFDLLHSHSSLSCTAFNDVTPTNAAITAPHPFTETIMIVDSSETGFSNEPGIHVVRDNMVDFKVIPDFPEDARLTCMHVF